ncbi:hypothetical protein [Nocardia arthritidis]|uniref:CopC domain-containing protein n=1 Tax=Nocardia arthritidis TaxID=228602 RepID=A0A6G9YEN8_9NOCA|nr:hypothetical protein [Nocardia arthritidis]QIS11634.1 hypothetical protein F5544_18825 [Nocardia arthritidis]
MRVLRTLAAIFGVTLLTLLLPATPASAVTPVTVVHTEHVKAGPYDVTLGFSVWPLRAMKSLDFTFTPDGGIAGKSGKLVLDGPGFKGGHEVEPLVRHPRERDDWGLDVRAFDAPGTYRIGFEIDGPAGHGAGALENLTVLDQPGPPIAASWVVCALPVLGLIALFAIAWRRVRPGRMAAAAPL